MSNRPLRTIILLITLPIVLVACTSAQPTPPEQTSTEAIVETVDSQSNAPSLAAFEKNASGYVDLTVDELATLLDAKEFTLVNVHIPDQGSLPNTDFSIAFNDVETFAATLPEQDAPIVIYCRSGGMSTQMAPALVEKGYTNLFELDGGFNAWAAAGYELLPSQQ